MSETSESYCRFPYCECDKDCKKPFAPAIRPQKQTPIRLEIRVKGKTEKPRF